MTVSGKGANTALTSFKAGTGRPKNLAITAGAGYKSQSDGGCPATRAAANTPVAPREIVTASGGHFIVLPVGGKVPERNRSAPRMVPVTRHVKRKVRSSSAVVR
eukprot:scaffold2657_cov89-Amphora_coffeaeformis.AAC.5